MRRSQSPACRRDDQLSDFNQQDLANAVNGFGKWPESPDCRDATFAIAGEVLRRGARLCDFTHQDLANLANGFSKWPDGEDCRTATITIAGEIRRRQLSDFDPRGLANLVKRRRAGRPRWTSRVSSASGTSDSVPSPRLS